MSENQDNKDNSIGLSRRDALRVGAAGSVAAAAGGAGAAASADSVKADTGSFVYAPTAPNRVGLAAAKGIGSVLDWVSDSNAEDLAILHAEARSELESLDAHLVNLDNTLTDTNTMANLEAREAIARAWEDGKDVGDAYTDALSAINDYYAERVERNHIQTIAKSAIQHSYLSQRALDHIIDGDRNLDDTDMALWNFVASPSHPEDYDLEWIELTDSRVEAEFELVNGETLTTTLPELLFEWENDEWKGTIADMDYQGGTGFDVFEFETDEGYTATWSGSIIIPNIPEAGLSGYTVLRFDRHLEYIREEEISSQASSVIGNYDESFVEDIYQALDAGNISPNELRGVDGQARFLSGDADVASDSYQLALYQQLNMDQPDLEEIASMTVEYSGFTDWFREPDDSGNIVAQYPQDHVDNRPMDGLLFAREIDNIEVGQRILVGELYHDTAGQIQHSLDEDREPYDPDIDEFDAVEFLDGTLYYLGDGQSYQIDLDGDEIEEFDYVGDVIDSHSTQDRLLWISSTSLFEFDGESINELAEHGYSNIEDTTINHNGFGIVDNDLTVWNIEGEKQYSHDVPEPEYADVEIGYLTDQHAVPIATVYADDGATHNFEAHLTTFDNSGIVDSLGVSENDDSQIEFETGSIGRFTYAIDHGWSSGGAGISHTCCITTGWIQPNGELYNTVETIVDESFQNETVHTEMDLINEEIRIDSPLSDVGGVYDFEGNKLSSDVSIDNEGFEPLVYPDQYDQIIPRFSTFYDALESEEVNMTLGSISIEKMTDTDGEEIEESEGWDDPEYDQYNVDEFLEYLEDSEEYQESLQQDQYWSPPDLPGVPGSDDLIPDIPRWAWLVPGGALAYALLSD
ncbi:hypothetical protein K0C01_05020 [Salinarchaeum sp. IM2453]|uniref:hypothetical protein n=1 Tax=Salinarchaeum sp. IM2453 TaxID=2862870 RepID=UPI001C82A15E|nr:hypothetical protein [Salinarchaeum sp. IM2453]QZA89499.1 hypothetical protein K0C01_05020 [Salinarchaeum sp. IM2453]